MVVIHMRQALLTGLPPLQAALGRAGDQPCLALGLQIQTPRHKSIVINAYLWQPLRPFAAGLVAKRPLHPRRWGTESGPPARGGGRGRRAQYLLDVFLSMLTDPRRHGSRSGRAAPRAHSRSGCCNALALRRCRRCAAPRDGARDEEAWAGGGLLSRAFVLACHAGCPSFPHPHRSKLHVAPSTRASACMPPRPRAPRHVTRNSRRRSVARQSRMWVT
eukprot:256355-Chlamydomonas_euryale.AAC.8